jgi:hypothetical protein
MAKEYVPIFFDWLEVTQDLSQEQKGNLIDAAILYATGGDWENVLKGVERIAFRFIKGQIDRNDAISAVRRQARANKREQNGTNDNKTEQNVTKQNKTEQTGTKSVKEKEKEKEKENKKEKESFLTDDDAAEIQNDHNRVLNAAEDAGFKMSNDVRASLIALYAEYGLDRMLEGFKSCVEHGALNLAYLRAVLSGKPRKPQKKVVAQDYDQRDYSSVQKTLEEAQRKRFEERLRAAQ